MPASADDLALHVDGKQVPLEVWSTPLRDANGVVQGSVVVFADITEKKRAESELRRYRDELEQRRWLRRKHRPRRCRASERESSPTP